jgi:hypothetical protein
MEMVKIKKYELDASTLLLIIRESMVKLTFLNEAIGFEFRACTH